MRLRRPGSDTVEAVAGPAERPGAKNRPTPKRSQARAARRTAPRTRKEAAAQQRDRTRDDRRRQRQALATGDERNLPVRDAGPARRLARDIVDSRVTSGQVFAGLVLLLLLVSLIPDAKARTVANVVALVMILGVILDGLRHAQRARRSVVERYGEDQGRGIATYALLRSMQPKRLRRPPARVKRGQQVE